MKGIKFKSDKGFFVFLRDNGLLQFIAKKQHVALNGVEIKVIGFLEDLTENDWNEVVDGHYNTDEGVSVDKNTGESYEYCHSWYEYFDYVNDKYDGVLSATESGKSLMKSLNIEDENWLLVKLSIHKN